MSFSSRFSGAKTRASLMSTTAVFVALGLAAPASAASLTWDDGASTASWNLTDANWTTETFVNGDDVTFGTTGAGTVTLTENIVVGDVTVNADGYTFAAAAAETLTFDGDIGTDGGQPVTLTVTTGGDTLTISAEIAGEADITLAGAGKLLLSGTNSSTGTITNSGTGTLENTGTWAGDVSNGATGTFTTSGTVSGDVTNAGTMNAEGTIGGKLTTTGGVTLTGNLSAGDLTIDGGSLTQTDGLGASTVTVDGTFVWDGTINGGTTVGDSLTIDTSVYQVSDGDTATTGTGTVALTYDTYLSLETAKTISQNFATEFDTTNTGATAFQIGNGAKTTISTSIDAGALNIGVLQGGTLDIVDSGAQTDVTNGGALTVDGTLDLGNTTSDTFGGSLAVTSAAIGSTGAVNIRSDSTLTVSGATTNEGALTIASGGTFAGDIENGTSSDPAYTGGTLTIGGTLTGSVTDSTGTITADGGSVSGSVTMTGGTFGVATGKSITVTGGVNVNGGTLDSNGTITGDVAVGDNGTFNTTGNAAAVTGAFTTTGAVNVETGEQLTVPTLNVNSGGTATVDGTVVGAVVVADGGSFVTNGGARYTSLTNAGTVEIPDQVSDTATWSQQDSFSQTASTGSITATASDDVTIANSGIFTLTGGTWSNIDHFTQSAGSTTISGSFSTTDWTISGGTFTADGTLTGDLTIGATADMIVASTANATDLTLNGDMTIVSGGQLTNATNQAVVFDINGTLTFVKKAGPDDTIYASGTGSITINVDQYIVNGSYSAPSGVTINAATVGQCDSSTDYSLLTSYSANLEICANGTGDALVAAGGLNMTTHDLTVAGNGDGTRDNVATGGDGELIVTAGSVTNVGTFTNNGYTEIGTGQSLTAVSVVNGGLLNVAGGTLAATGTSTITNNMVIDVTAGGSITDAGNFVNASTGTVNFDGDATDGVTGAAMTFDVAGLITNNGTLNFNQYSDATNIDNATSIQNNFGGSLNVYNGANADATGIAVSNGGTMTVNSGGSWTSGLITNLGTGVLNVGGGVTANVTSAGTINAVGTNGTVTGSVTMTGGSFDIGTGEIIGITGGLAVSGGTVTSNGTLTGNVTMTGGTFNTTGTTAVVTGALTTSGTVNVETGEKLTVTTLNVNGGTTTVDGTIAGAVAVASGGTFATNGDARYTSLTNAGTFQIKDQVSNTATWNQKDSFSQTAGTGSITATAADVVTIANTGSFTLTGGTMTNIDHYTQSGSTSSTVISGTYSTTDWTISDGTFTADGSLTGNLTIGSSGEMIVASTANATDLTLNGDMTITTGGTLTNATGEDVVFTITGSLTFKKKTGPGGLVGNDTIYATGGGSITINVDQYSVNGNYSAPTGVTINAANINQCDTDTDYTLETSYTANLTICADGTGDAYVAAGGLNMDPNKGAVDDAGPYDLTVAGNGNGTLEDTATGGDGVLMVTAGSVINVGTFTNSGYTEIGNGQSLTAESIINNGLIVIGVGTLEATGTSTITNNMVIDVAAGGSIVDAGNFVNSSTGTVNFNGDATDGVTGAAMTFDVAGTITNSGDINFNQYSDTTNILHSTGIHNNASGAITVYDGANAVATGITVANAGDLTVNDGGAWTSGTVTTSSGGTTTVDGDMTAAQVVQSGGTLDIGATGTLVGSVQNGTSTGTPYTGGTLNIAGRLEGGVTDSTGAITVEGTLGTVTGTVAMTGGTFTVDTGEKLTVGELDVNGGTANTNGQIAGGVVVGDAGTFNTTGNAASITGGSLTTTGTVDIGSGEKLTVGTTNVNGGTTTVAGTLTGNALVGADGTLVLTGTEEGNLSNSGATSARGAVTGNVANNGTGTFDLTGSLNVTGSFTNNSTSDTALTVASGETLSASTFTTLAGTSVIEGTISGPATFGGSSTVLATGTTGQVTGTLTMAGGTLDLSGDTPSAGDSFSIGGNLNVTSDSTFALDVDGSSSDTVNVSGSYLANGGNLELAINMITVPAGDAVTLVDFGTANGASAADTAVGGNITATYTGSPTGLYIPYLTKNASDTAIILDTDLSNSVGGTVANIALSQTLLNTIINRPSSPFVSGLAVQDGNQCSKGTWARLYGGSGTVTGTGRQDINSNPNELPSSDISMNFAGLVGGFDFGCFDGRSAGWDLVTGAIVGYNTGTTSQDIYELGVADPQTRTTSDFTQSYAGVYIAASNDKLSADLKVRFEQTSFSMTNTDLIPGNVFAENGLDNTSLGSTGVTVSGSMSYFIALNKDSSVGFVPTGGFGYTTTKTDSLTFPGTSATAQIEDHSTLIGFLGGTLARTKLNTDGISATTTFLTGTYYNDFSDAVVTDFTDGVNSGQITTDPLGSFIEASAGMSYVRILDKGQFGKARQLDVSGRVDARFSGDVSAVGVTLQGRLQF